jgi:hypothetical protein
MARSLPSEVLMRLHSMGKFLALTADIRVVLKGLTASNTLAYYNKNLITVLKSFIVKARGLSVHTSNKSLFVLVNNIKVIDILLMS